MTPVFSAVAPATDLLDLFSSLDSGSLFKGLTTGVGGQPPILGSIGWIFTGFGAALVLWGFVLRSQHSQGGDKLTEIVRTLLVVVSMVSGPMLMRTAMQGADSVYASAIGSPHHLALACARAAYALPEVTVLFDLLRRPPSAPGVANSPSAPGSPAAPAGGASPATGGSVLGYLEAVGTNFGRAVSATASTAGLTAAGIVRMLALMDGFGSAMIKCILVSVCSIALYLLLLISAAIVWFMEQFRYFLAVTGTMMLPLFLGMFSLPAGHPNRGPAQAYVMHLLSLALWPVAWAIGHTGTIALFNFMMELASGTSRVPAIAELLQWDSITGGAPLTSAQVQGLEVALGNWFMGNTVPLLALVVFGAGFAAWVLMVTVMGPVFLHKLLTTGALFMNQAMAAGGRAGYSALRSAPATPTGVRGAGGATVREMQTGVGKKVGASESASPGSVSGPGMPWYRQAGGTPGSAPPITLASTALKLALPPPAEPGPPPA
jgi:hypothetical protein